MKGYNGERIRIPLRGEPVPDLVPTFDKPRVGGLSRGTPYARGAVLPSEGNGWWCSRSYSTLITAPMMTISEEK